MKLIFYIVLAIGAIGLTISQSWRGKALTVASAAVSVLTNLGDSAASAEVRKISATDFNTTISEKDKLVVVVIHHNLSKQSRQDYGIIKDAGAELPGEVLLASISAESNIPLLNRLNIKHVPSVCIYRAGQRIHTYPLDELDSKKIVELVTPYATDKTASGPGTIEKMPTNPPLPPGVQRARE